MKKLKLVGEKFGRLTVVKEAESHGWSYFYCKCDCGNEIIVKGTFLKTGKTKSCGCLQKEKARDRLKKHGLSRGRIYRIWNAMNTRCNNPHINQHKDYHDRGISVCAEWKNFKDFYNWAINNGYRDDLSIDRIDNDSGYSPENCRWATPKIQNRNSRRCIKVEYNGEIHCLSEWEEILGIKKHTLAYIRHLGKNEIDIIKRYYNEIK